MSTILVNQVPVDVTFTDGKTDTVNISVLSISKLYVFMRHLKDRDAPAIVAFCTGKTLEWVDTLTIESFQELSGKVMDLNFPRAAKLSEKDSVAQSLITSFSVDLAQGVSAVLSGSTGKTLSPELLRLVSAAGTGTESSSSPPPAS